uniref:Uncharacterized protein n=1 Tax=Oryzias melastigma TaxID=30732 RepID=A0A3B3DWL4_ORYME
MCVIHICLIMSVQTSCNNRKSDLVPAPPHRDAFSAEKPIIPPQYLLRPSLRLLLVQRCLEHFPECHLWSDQCSKEQIGFSKSPKGFFISYLRPANPSPLSVLHI